MVEIFVPNGDWIVPTCPNPCEKKEFEFTEHSYEGSTKTKIKISVDFSEVENPCGVEEETLISGLDDAVIALEYVQLSLREYMIGMDDESKQHSPPAFDLWLAPWPPEDDPFRNYSHAKLTWAMRSPIRLRRI